MALFLTGTEKPDRKVEEIERGEHVAKDLNLGWLLSAVWDMLSNGPPHFVAMRCVM